MHRASAVAGVVGRARDVPRLPAPLTMVDSASGGTCGVDGVGAPSSEEAGAGTRDGVQLGQGALGPVRAAPQRGQIAWSTGTTKGTGPWPWEDVEEGGAMSGRGGAAAVSETPSGPPKGLAWGSEAAFPVAPGPWPGEEGFVEDPVPGAERPEGGAPPSFLFRNRRENPRAAIPPRPIVQRTCSRREVVLGAGTKVLPGMERGPDDRPALRASPSLAPEGYGETGPACGPVPGDPCIREGAEWAGRATAASRRRSGRTAQTGSLERAPTSRGGVAPIPMSHFRPDRGL